LEKQQQQQQKKKPKNQKKKAILKGLIELSLSQHFTE